MYLLDLINDPRKYISNIPSHIFIHAVSMGRMRFSCPTTKVGGYMNVRKLFSWGKSATESNTGEPQVAVATDGGKRVGIANSEGLPDYAGDAAANAPSNIVPIHSVFRDGQQPEIVQPQNKARGLMGTPELTAFFSDNHFGLGRHNGAYFRTQDALELGKRSLISKFQNTLDLILTNIQTEVYRRENELIRIKGLSPAMSEQLELACEHLRQQILTLTKQIDEADNQKGWVRQALNDYHIGFLKGLSGAIAFEQLIA